MSNYPDGFSILRYDAAMGRDEADDASEIRAAQATIPNLEAQLSILHGVETSDPEWNITFWNAVEKLEEAISAVKGAVS